MSDIYYIIYTAAAAAAAHVTQKTLSGIGTDGVRTPSKKIKGCDPGERLQFGAEYRASYLLFLEYGGVQPWSSDCSAGGCVCFGHSSHHAALAFCNKH